MHISILQLVSCLILATVTSAATISSATGNTTSTCQELASVISDHVYFPETLNYNASILSYPFLQSRLHPTCVVRPRTTEEVVTIVNILRKRSLTKFAVKGGGHNANVEFNNIIDGVTIDLQSINQTHVDLKTQVAQVGGGSIWQGVYDAVEPHNLTVLGGRIGVVGVGGFTTGGGISFFSPEKGWACDAVVNFEVVLASGKIVNANATSNSDLWAALKGGQNNFGIVTRFDLQGFPHGPIWGGRINYDPSTEDKVVQAFTDFKNPVNFDPYAAGWVTFRYNGTLRTVTPTSIMWYTKPEAAPGALANITGIVPKGMAAVQTAYAGAFARNASNVVKVSQSYTIWATTTFKISPTIVKSIHAHWKSTISNISDTYAYANIASELTFQALAVPPPASKPDSLGFTPDDTPQKDLVFLQIIFYFGDKRAIDGLNDALKTYIKAFEDLTEKEGVKSDFLYLNFAAWFQDPLAGYGQKSLENLRRVSKQYDPKGLFQKQLVGGFKLFNITAKRGRYEW